MLTQVLDMAMCLCLSKVGVLSKWRNDSGWFALELPLTYHTLCHKEILVVPKIRVFLSGTAQNSTYRKLHHGISIVKMCYQLSSKKVDAHSMKNWTVVGQLSWQYLRAWCSTAVVYHSKRQALSTARFRCVGQLVTADICLFKWSKLP